LIVSVKDQLVLWKRQQSTYRKLYIVQPNEST
jgi:hypothetical protein